MWYTVDYQTLAKDFNNWVRACNTLQPLLSNQVQWWEKEVWLNAMVHITHFIDLL